MTWRGRHPLQLIVLTVLLVGLLAVLGGFVAEFRAAVWPERCDDALSLLEAPIERFDPHVLSSASIASRRGSTGGSKDFGSSCEVYSINWAVEGEESGPPGIRIFRYPASAKAASIFAGKRDVQPWTELENDTVLRGRSGVTSHAIALYLHDCLIVSLGWEWRGTDRGLRADLSALNVASLLGPLASAAAFEACDGTPG